MRPGVRTPYMMAHLRAGLLTYGVKAYPNAAVCMSTNAEAYYNADAYECNRSRLITGHLQTASTITKFHAPPRETINKTASAITDHVVTCESMVNNASADVHKNSMSSQQERIELVTLPPQHIGPCATQLTIASAIKPVPPPRSFKSKNIAKSMTRSGCQNEDVHTDVPLPGQSNNKTSAVIINDETTFAPKGFNHLSHSKVRNRLDLRVTRLRRRPPVLFYTYKQKQLIKKQLSRYIFTHKK